MTFTVNGIDTAPVATIPAVVREFSELELQLAVLLDSGITTVAVRTCATSPTDSYSCTVSRN